MKSYDLSYTNKSTQREKKRSIREKRGYNYNEATLVVWNSKKKKKKKHSV